MLLIFAKAVRKLLKIFNNTRKQKLYAYGKINAYSTERLAVDASLFYCISKTPDCVNEPPQIVRTAQKVPTAN